MQFELLDGYLLDGRPGKADVVQGLLAQAVETPAARAFYEGLRLLGARTPDLALIALRLVLSGRPAEDSAVVTLRELAERARTGDAQARAEYLQMLAPSA
jgi:hypothetical protein